MSPSSLPKEFGIEYQKGIAGGITPPVPEDIYTITKRNGLIPEDQLYLYVTVDLRPTPNRPSGGKEENKWVDYNAPVQEFLEAVPYSLKHLPTGYPDDNRSAPVHDFYGYDIAIRWESEGFTWRNASAEGCTGDDGPKATPQQRAEFWGVVEIIRQIVGREQEVE